MDLNNKESISGDENPWILTVDNIFLDVARSLPDNSFLLENKLIPGSQYTATTPELKQFAQKIFEMRDGEQGSK